MNIKCDDIRKEKEQVSKELDKIGQLEKKFPKGKIIDKE